MGIDLGDVVVKNPTTLAAWSGKWVAIDAWNVLYQFLSSIRGRDGSPLMNSKGEITSHISGVLSRTTAMLELGIKPVFVFDGKAHELKRETIAGRNERRAQAETDWQDTVEAGDMEEAQNKARQSSKLTWAMADDAALVLEAMGVPVVRAPSDGEAQAAYMAARGWVQASASQDFDSLLFGTPTLIRNATLSGRRKLPGKQVWVDVEPELIHLNQTLTTMGLSREQLVDAAILVGTDFNKGIKGIGAKKAIQIVKDAGSLEAALVVAETGKSAALKAIHEQKANLADFQEVRNIFLSSDGIEVPELKISKPDHAAIRALLVDKFEFQPDRVTTAIEKLDALAGKSKQANLFGF